MHSENKTQEIAIQANSLPNENHNKTLHFGGVVLMVCNVLNQYITKAIVENDRIHRKYSVLFVSFLQL